MLRPGAYKSARSFVFYAMPWKAFKVGSQFCVYKLDASGNRTGKTLGCHPSRAAANRQVAALNVNEDKEVAEVAEVEVADKAIHDATSFSELEEAEQEHERVEKVRRDMGRFLHLAENIMFGEEGNKGSALSRLANEFATRVKNLMNGEEEEDEEEKQVSVFRVYKASDGRWHWLAIYSNSSRDNDTPREIVSAKSHKNFVQKVDSGEWELPELWLWHERGWKCGQALAVAFDEVSPGAGMAIAAGIFDKEAEPVARALAKSETMLVSHGMDLVQKSTGHIIDHHRTFEISPLPGTKAANRLTQFSVVGESQMALSKEKREEMARAAGVDADDLLALENMNAQSVSKALREGVEFKEQEDDPEVQETEEVPVPAADEEEKPEYVTAVEMKEVAGEIVRGVQDALKALVKEVETLRKEVKAVQTAAARKEAEDSPAASIYGLITSAVGAKETQVDGRTKIAKTGPEETEPVAGPTPSGFLNGLIQQSGNRGFGTHTMFDQNTMQELLRQPTTLPENEEA